MGSTINGRKTYAIINSETKKILKYNGKLEYCRTMTFANVRRIKLQNELGIKLELKKLK